MENTDLRGVQAISLPGQVLDDAFYTDGRHEELVDLIPEVNGPLGIHPWDDDQKLLDMLAQ